MPSCTVADLVYALPTVYAICAFIVVFAVVHRGWVAFASGKKYVHDVTMRSDKADAGPSLRQVCSRQVISC
jgi:hypothetical protein